MEAEHLAKMERDMNRDELWGNRHENDVGINTDQTMKDYDMDLP